MAEKKSKTQPNKIVIISIIIALVIVVVGAIFIFYKPNKSENVEQQSDYDRSLSKVQEEINAQQKVIDKINEELKPLIEQRTELENKINSLSGANQTSETEKNDDSSSSEQSEQSSENTENVE